MVEMRMWEPIFACALVLALALAACNKKQGPPLSETLSWMSRTYNSDGTAPGTWFGGYGGHGWYQGPCMAKCEEVGSIVYFHETFTYKDCEIMTLTVSNRRTDHGLRGMFNLRDVDPKTVHVTNDPLGDAVAEVGFSTRNNIRAVSYKGNITVESDNSGFDMDDVAYARRFAEAFRHAVDLCGGKPSDFPEASAATDEVPVPPGAVTEAPAPPHPSSVAESPQELFKRLSSSVFVVETLDASGSVVATGSGVMLAPGEMVTNKHVIEEGTAWRVSHGREVWAATVGRVEVAHDLCELNVPGLNAPPVAVRASSTLAVGERVYAIGAPEGLELTLTEGVVSGLRDYGGGRVIQTSAAISPGSSGGGLFDAQGRLIGITTFSMREGQNLNFALPTEWVEALVGR